jgi:hypothetical protein
VTLIKSNSNLGAEYGEVCHMKKFQWIAHNLACFEKRWEWLWTWQSKENNKSSPGVSLPLREAREFGDRRFFTLLTSTDKLYIIYSWLSLSSSVTTNRGEKSLSWTQIKSGHRYPALSETVLPTQANRHFLRAWDRVRLNSEVDRQYSGGFLGVTDFFCVTRRKQSQNWSRTKLGFWTRKS